MQKKYDVTALGEILIDFTAAGKNADGKNIYEENLEVLLQTVPPQLQSLEELLRSLE